MNDDPMVICSFKDRKSRRDLADLFVQKFPDRFPNRSAVYLKAFNLLVESQELEFNSQKSTVDEGLQANEESIITKVFGKRGPRN